MERKDQSFFRAFVISMFAITLFVGSLHPAVLPQITEEEAKAAVDMIASNPELSMKAEELVIQQNILIEAQKAALDARELVLDGEKAGIAVQREVLTQAQLEGQCGLSALQERKNELDSQKSNDQSSVSSQESEQESEED